MGWRWDGIGSREQQLLNVRQHASSTQQHGLLLITTSASNTVGLELRCCIPSLPCSNVRGFSDIFGFHRPTPIDWALSSGHWPMARLLIRTGGGDSLDVLEGLHAAVDAAACDADVQQAAALFAEVAASRPLANEEWELLPYDTPGLAAALPAVLARSREEAAHLVRRLPQVRA